MEMSWMLCAAADPAVHFLLGRRCVLRHVPPAGRHDGVHVVAKQWMWKFQHPTGQREIDTLHVPVGRADPPDDDQPGRDPQPVRAGVSREAGRAAGPIHVAVVRGRPKSGEYHLFCAEYCGTNHSADARPRDRDDAATIIRNGSAARQGRRAARRSRAKAVRAVPLRQLPHWAADGARGPALDESVRQPVQADNGQTVTADEAISASRSCGRKPKSSPASSRSCRRTTRRSARKACCI